MEQPNTQSSIGNQSVLREILYVLKRNIILFLVVIFLGIAVGSVYASVRKPNYVATERLLFRMGDSGYIAEDINTMSAYKITVQSFANQGKVVDRANYYATKYYEFASKNGVDLNTFVGLVESLEGQVKSCLDEKQVWEEIMAISTTLQNNSIANATGVANNLSIQRMILYCQAFLMKRIRIEEFAIASSTNSAFVARLTESVQNSKEYLSKLRRKDTTIIVEKDYQTVITEACWYDFNILEVVDKEERPEYVSEFATNFLNKSDKDHYEEHQQACADRIDEINTELGMIKSTSLGLILYYDVENEEVKKTFGKQKYISSSKIGIISPEKDVKSFVFNISYNDENEARSKEKVKLLALAFDIESSYFFTAKNTTIDDLGLVSCAVDTSKTKIILISTAISVVLACVSVYLVYILDKTIKSKEEAEKIAGCSVLACIEARKV